MTIHWETFKNDNDVDLVLTPQTAEDRALLRALQARKVAALRGVEKTNDAVNRHKLVLRFVDPALASR